MWDKIKGRFNARRLLLIAALAGVALYVGWRSGGFDGQPVAARLAAAGGDGDLQFA